LFPSPQDPLWLTPPPPPQCIHSRHSLSFVCQKLIQLQTSFSTGKLHQVLSSGISNLIFQILFFLGGHFLSSFASLFVKKNVVTYIMLLCFELYLRLTHSHINKRNCFCLSFEFKTSSLSLTWVLWTFSLRYNYFSTMKRT
jgi:hypothetical protein